MKASLDGDVHLQVLSKDAMTGLKKIYPGMLSRSEVVVAKNPFSPSCSTFLQTAH